MKCTCKRMAPRCDYCRDDKRKRNKAAYTTEKRRERAKAERRRKAMGLVSRDYLDVATAERMLQRKPPSSAITWLDIYAGRANS